MVYATTMHYQLRAQETNGVTVGVCGILLHTYHPLPFLRYDGWVYRYVLLHHYQHEDRSTNRVTGTSVYWLCSMHYLLPTQHTDGVLHAHPFRWVHGWLWYILLVHIEARHLPVGAREGWRVVVLCLYYSLRPRADGWSP
jgi:hypothetical protein